MLFHFATFFWTLGAPLGGYLFRSLNNHEGLPDDPGVGADLVLETVLGQVGAVRVRLQQLRLRGGLFQVKLDRRNGQNPGTLSRDPPISSRLAPPMTLQ